MTKTMFERKQEERKKLHRQLGKGTSDEELYFTGIKIVSDVLKTPVGKKIFGRPGLKKITPAMKKRAKKIMDLRG
jgi:hypothetical protein